MRTRLRTGAVALVLLLLLLFAYSPLLRTGLLARDAELLARAHDVTHPLEEAQTSMHPLESYSLMLSSKLFGQVEPGLGWQGGAFFLRLENLCLLVFGAGALGVLTRRLLLPWCGNDQALAAARAAAVIFALHPLATSAVASLDARGDLIGLAIALAASALFLKGRQDRRFGWTATSFFLCVLGSFASDIAFVLPLFFAVFEFVSSHRYRPISRRLRTSVTTLLVFGGAASVPSLFQSTMAAGSSPFLLRAGAGQLTTLEGWGDSLRIAAEKLGLLVLPANAGALGIAGPILAGAIFLVAMQPALVAARSAPRLWGWLLVFWFLALFGAELIHAHVRVSGEDIALAHVMLPSAAVMAVGLGIGSTALSGPRRPYVAWGVALVYAVLSFGNAQPWTRAAAEVAELRSSLMEVGLARDKKPRVLVLDPPRAVDGVDPLGSSLSYLLPPAEGAGEKNDGLPRVCGLRREAFRLLLRQPEFEAWRSEDVVVFVPAEESVPSDGVSSGYVAFSLDRPLPSSGPRSWRGLRSPTLDLGPESELVLKALAPSGADPSLLGPLSWSARGVGGSQASLEPVWVYTREGLCAYYDLEGSFSWLFGGRVRLLWFEEGVLPTDNSILASVPNFETPPEPRVLGADWVFDVPDTSGFRPVEGAGSFRLTLLDMASFKSAEFQLEKQGSTTSEKLHARDAVDFVTRIGRKGGGPLVWSLRFEVGGAVLLRCEGRFES